MEPTCHYCGLTTKFRCRDEADAKQCSDYKAARKLEAEVSRQLAAKPKPRLIGLYSPTMQSGKSTAANYLMWGHGFVRVSFAEPLKQMARTFLQNYEKDATRLDLMLHGNLKEEKVPGLGVTPRWIMQTLGTEWGRVCISNTVWVDAALAQAGRHLAAGRSVVIDDMRFPNEYTAVAAVGEPWVVKRPNATMQGSDRHPSEGQLDFHAFKQVLLNLSTKDALYRQIDAALRNTTPL